MNITGNRIRELRIKHNMTLDDVARHLSVGRQAIYKYEQGTVTNIPLENLEKMAELFGVTPGYLAGWSDEPPDDPLQHHTKESIRIVSGVDKMPPELRTRAEQMLMLAFAEYFKEDPNSDT